MILLIVYSLFSLLARKSVDFLKEKREAKPLFFYKPKSSFVVLIFAACDANGVNFILHNDKSDKGNEDSEN